MMMTTQFNTTLWTVTLAAAAVLGSLATACMMPFVALATIAAKTLPRGQAVIAVLGAWAANQFLGFALLGYPVDGYAIGWGLALGAASLAVIPLVRRLGGTGLIRLAVAFVAAFAVWEGLLFAFALAFGGTDTFTPAIVLRLFANDALWLAVLTGLHLVATLGAPQLFGNSRFIRLG
ncbi:hypothetical protein [Sphingomonas radiodurans]|uniref:hypothetical protein n=1 Tax=Sphingomonas radiodurans TaxID=2890321 RepID=UPI001E6237D6|nr:hypothetical protein [Sphingomonas radiodurans]WBH17384.1 hypothetical protein LLW23_04550 [Sphingomonas radiodurans]